MTRKERLVREATKEVLTKLLFDQEVDPEEYIEIEKEVRKILRKLYDDAYDDGERTCRRILDGYYYARR